ncbi:hypothetical protein J3459_009967 [Metarhizium acridum]|nr:hypothetical protein J3459_009967 [Metarhizium acridum]
MRDPMIIILVLLSPVQMSPRSQCRNQACNVATCSPNTLRFNTRGCCWQFKSDLMNRNIACVPNVVYEGCLRMRHITRGAHLLYGHMDHVQRSSETHLQLEITNWLDQNDADAVPFKVNVIYPNYFSIWINL